MLTLPASVEVVTIGLISEKKAYTKRGLIDTGTNRSAISVRIADELGLYYEREDGMDHRNLNQVEYLGTAWVWLQLVNDETGERIRTMHLPVSIQTFNSDIDWHPDVLIGMDVLSLGRFCVDSISGETVVTFEI